MSSIMAWRVHQPGSPMELDTLPQPELEPGKVLVRVVGCGVCHTDLGFFYHGVKTVLPPPLALGHEISGVVEKVGDGTSSWLGKKVIVPAVMPCGECCLCKKGRERICRNQIMPGNHISGGFASHVVVPSRHLCPVEIDSKDGTIGPSEVTLKELSVVADAVSTPYQAVENVDLKSGDVAVFVGIGGVGGFGVQIARARGAVVVAVDVDQDKLDSAVEWGAEKAVLAGGTDPRQIRREVRDFVKERDLSPYEWKIFECSGTAAGQETAFALLTYGSTLAVVGFTLDKVEIRLSNLMAFDAQVVGNWGCDPGHYPAAVKLIEEGKVQLSPQVEFFPLSQINEVFEKLHRHQIKKRPILIPDFE